MDGDKSNQDNASFSNTLLELGNALSVYLSLSKLENSDSLQYPDMLLETFPIMRKLALDQDLLLLDLQRRMLELSIKVAALKIARDGEKAPSEFAKNHSACNIFGVLRADRT